MYKANRSRKELLSCAALLLSAFGPAPSSAQLASRTADEWITALETPERIQSLKIAEVMTRLALKPGQIIADIGAGSGVFSIQFSRSVRPGGKVFAVEIDEKLIEHISTSATEQGIINIEGVFGEYDNPLLPEIVDLAFIHDTLHHIEHRDAYLKNLAEYVKPGGRVAIIDFKAGRGDHANEPTLQVTQEQVTAWMAAAGFKPVETLGDLSPDRWFVIYARQ